MYIVYVGCTLKLFFSKLILTVNKPKSHCTVEMVLSIQKILVLPCISSMIVKYSQYCSIAKRCIFAKLQSNLKYQQVMLERSEHVKRRG